jgi:hypothetical protein
MITFKQFLLEGGAAGHMAHPFDLPEANTGKNLINIFNKLIKSLAKTPASLKIDGINASIKLIDNEKNQKEFALDRGSNKPEDIAGVTLNKLSSRFPTGHGMHTIGATVLSIFNTAIPSIERDLKELGMWDNNKILFNMEYVKGETNVVGYVKNFLAIHGLNEIISVKSPVRGSISRASREISFNKDALLSLIDKVNPIAKKQGFDVEHEFTVSLKNINLNAALQNPFSVSYSTKNIITKPLNEWLSSAKNPRNEKVKLKSGRTISAMSLENYKNISNGMPLDMYVDEKSVQKVIDGAIFYQATISLGQAIKNAATSDLGSLNTQEGIVVRDSSISNNPVKITGNFITGREASKFAQKKSEEESSVASELKNITTVGNKMNYQTNPPYGMEGSANTLTPKA